MSVSATLQMQLLCVHVFLGDVSERVLLMAITVVIDGEDTGHMQAA